MSVQDPGPQTLDDLFAAFCTGTPSRYRPSLALHQDDSGPIEDAEVRAEPTRRRWRSDPTRGVGTAPRGMDADAAWRLVVASEQPPDAPSHEKIVDALRPLIDLRGGLPPLIYRHRPQQAPFHSSVYLWAEAHAAEIEDTAYFLVAGDPASTPFELTRHLGIGKLVGRLHLPTEEDYNRYALRVNAADKPTFSTPSRPVSLFATNGDYATGLSERVLITPLAKMLRAQENGPPVRSLIGATASWPALARQFAHPGAAAPRPREIGRDGSWSGAGATLRDGSHLAPGPSQPPSLLVAACHGAGPEGPGGSGLGAMVDIKNTRLTAEYFTETFPDGLVSDGIAILFACNVAGTCQDWTQSGPLGPALDFDAHEDRSSPATQAILSHPNGPLAIVAHDGVIYEKGLRDLLDRTPASLHAPGIRPFAAMVDALHRNVPVGLSLRRLARAHQAAAEHMATVQAILSRQTKITPYQRDSALAVLHRWAMLRNWTVLGDPRVTLEGCQATVTLQDAFRGSVI